MDRRRIIRQLLILVNTTVMLSLAPQLGAADYEFVSLENVFVKPQRAMTIQPHAIVLASSQRRFTGLSQRDRGALRGRFVYQTRVRVKGKLYFRLTTGNFQSPGDAANAISGLKAVYPDAWMYRRSGVEAARLGAYLQTIVGADLPAPVPGTTAPVSKPIAPVSRPTASVSRPAAPGGKTTATGNEPSAADKMLEDARQAFIDQNYARAVAITDKILQIADLEQMRIALELAGTARERQGKYTQAVDAYERLLETEPSEEVASRVSTRLQGIRTMTVKPRARIADNRDEEEVQWNTSGSLIQYYRNDLVDRSKDDGTEEINQSLVTDLNLFMQRRTEVDSLMMQFDAGLVLDNLEDSTDTRVTRASLSYSRDDFRITGGRQSRTIKGVFGKFDGLVYSHLLPSDYRLGLVTGYLVDSSFDSLDSDRPLVGANLGLSPRDWLDIDLYAMQQEISGLTDREAIGGEVSIRRGTDYLYGVVDYDVFFEELNNLTLISNYQYNAQWAYNLTLTHGFSPTLSTVNALQGQTATSIEELQQEFSDDEIYQLARDRTSKSDSIIVNINYRIDADRQIFAYLSSFRLDGTEASGGIEEIPDSDDLQFSVDYSLRGFFTADDYTTIGIRLADATTSETLSLRLQTRFSGPWGLVYDPRIRLDLRHNKNNDVDQTIVKPSIRIRYRRSRQITFESDIGIEHSDFDLPEFDDQTAYFFYLGYTYLF